MTLCQELARFYPQPRREDHSLNILRRLGQGFRLVGDWCRPDEAVRVILPIIIAVWLSPMCLGAATPQIPRASAQPYASSPAYQDTLRELARRAPRPSQLSDTGELLHPKPFALPIRAHDTGAGLTIETASYRLEITKNPFQLSWIDKVTQARWDFQRNDKQSSGIVWELMPDGPASAFPLKQVTQIRKTSGGWDLECQVGGNSHAVLLEIKTLTPGIIFLSIDGKGFGRGAWLDFQVSAEGPFFGLGEQYLHANLAGMKIPLRPISGTAAPGHDWDYMQIPFVYAPQGLGIYFDTAFPAIADFTEADRQRFKMKIEGPTVDCYLFAGKSPAKVLEKYTALTGRTPLPPPWAFGVWHNSLEGARAVLADARRLRAERIPVSALWVSDMMDDATNLGWSHWTYGYYGQPGEFNQQLHQLGFKALGYVHPYVRPELLPYLLSSPLYREAVSHHYLALCGSGQPGSPLRPCPVGNVDFTDPQAVNWWCGMLQTILMKFHFDGWMEDYGELMDHSYHFAAGRSGRVMRVLYPLFYHKISYQFVHGIDPGAVEFSRSGAPGSQAFTPVLWGGDQNPNWSTKRRGLPTAVTAGITAGLSGFSIWGPDILSSGTSKELWVRWMEFGALTPIMRDHLWNAPKFAVDLWFDQETTDLFRSYAGLHISLFPYFYTFAQQATKTGLPIMRHFILAWPHDPMTYTAEYEYLLGDRILVAPVIHQGANARQLYLPEGSWVDYWSGRIFEGGREVTVPAPLDHIPIMVKAGAIIPFISPQTQTLAADLAKGKYRTLGTGLTWRVFPSATPASSDFRVYDGAAAKATTSPGKVLVQGSSPIIRDYRVDVPAGSVPHSVVLNGTPLTAMEAAGYRAGKRGWWFDSFHRTLRVVFLADRFRLEVVDH